MDQKPALDQSLRLTAKTNEFPRHSTEKLSDINNVFKEENALWTLHLCCLEEETLYLPPFVLVDSPSGDDELSDGAIAGIVIGVLVLVVIIIGGVYYYKSKQSK